MNGHINTAFDVMKEYMVIGAEFDGKYQIPIVESCNTDAIANDTVDFADSFSRSIKNHKQLCVNFYIDDAKFLRLWNNTDKYLEHLSAFHSVIMPDFSISTGIYGMPFALNVYNKYRNHAIGYYLQKNGITVIPSVGIPDINGYELCFSGYKKHSVLSISTIGRMKSKSSRDEFREGFVEMCKRLQPVHVIVVGHIPDEIMGIVPITNYMSRNQKINKMFLEKNGNTH